MANEKRLIDANALVAEIKETVCKNCNSHNGIRCGSCWVDDTIGFLQESPTIDAVSRGVLDQVRWERDVAIKQLEEHGIPFCGIAPDVVKVVRCKDCKYYNREESECYVKFDCDGNKLCVGFDYYCADGKRRAEKKPAE